MEVFERTGGATIQVKAGGPGFDYNIIPADAWFRVAEADDDMEAGL